MNIHTLNQNTQQSTSWDTQIVNSISRIGIGAGVGALAGYAFEIIDPVGGAIFGATAELVVVIGDRLADKLCMNRTILKTAAYAVAFITSIGVGIFVTTAAGFPLTVTGAVGIVLTSFVTSIGIIALRIGACGLCSCVGGAALAANEQYC